MSLTVTDLHDIRSIMREEMTPLVGRVEALENDIKEIYYMLRDIQESPTIK